MKNFYRSLCLLVVSVFWLCFSLEGLEVGEPLGPGGRMFDVGDGMRANLRLEEQNFRIYFIDAEGLLIEPPFSKALVLWEEKLNTLEKGRLVLTPRNGLYLGHGRKFYPPFQYRVNTLIVDGDNEILHNFPVTLIMNNITPPSENEESGNE